MQNKRVSFVEFVISTAVVAALTLAAMSCPGEAEAATFPYYNLQGYQTTLYVVNQTGEEVTTGGFYPGVGLPVRIAPYGTARFTSWPGPGGNIAPADIPAGLSAFVEVKDPTGASVRIPAITGLYAAEVRGLTSDKDQRACLFIASVGPVVVTFYEGSRETGTIEPDMASGIAIPDVPAGSDRAVVALQPGRIIQGPVYLFAFHRHITGHYEIQNPVLSTEVK